MTRGLPGAVHDRALVRRVLAGTGSNAYAQATTIAIQLLSLPLFLSRWSLDTYGAWLILSAIPSCLSMADVGMVTAAGNRMTMLIGDGQFERANAVFQSTLVFMLGVCGAALLLVGAAVGASVAAEGLWPTAWPLIPQGRTSVLLLTVGVVVTLFSGLPEAVYRATGRYALGAGWSNTTRLAEWLGGLVGLWAFGSMAGVAAGALLPRVLGTAAMVVHARRSAPQFRWGWSEASWHDIRRSAAPAISFMAFPAANALNFQGMTLIAGAVLGPASAVVFNTYRTLGRVTVQATGTFSHALWPEFSRLYGKGHRGALSVLYRRSCWIGLALAAAAGATVFACAPTVLQLWSKGRIAFSAPLMGVCMAYAAVAGAAHVSRVLLLSTNAHSTLAWPTLVASAAVLPLAVWLAHRDGVSGILLSMLLLEAVLLAVTTGLARRLLKPLDSAKPLGAAT